MGTDLSRIWVLGNVARGTGTSINWLHEKITSFADCDTLIVDTTTLNKDLIKSIEFKTADLLFTEIQKRFKTGLLIICIPSPTFQISLTPGQWLSHSINNYFWSPIDCNYKKTPPGKKLKKRHGDNFSLDPYVDSITEWNLSMPCIPTIKVSCQSGEMLANPSTIIESNSDDLLGGEWSFDGAKGSVIFLPPLETPKKSLDKIFEILGFNGPTPPPEWASNVKISRISHYEEKITKIENEITKQQQEKNKFSSQLEKLRNFRKLVYETDDELENTVMDALKLLGLSKVRKGNPGKDDLLFDFSKNKTFSLCSVEIKGITGSLKLRDLRQSNNWVEDHMEYSKIKAKGLVICNTFRDIELKKSLKERNNISKENLEYANSREVCILPTHVLLDLCNHVLDENLIDVKVIENTIATTNGILALNSILKDS